MIQFIAGVRHFLFTTASGLAVDATWWVRGWRWPLTSASVVINMCLYFDCAQKCVLQELYSSPTDMRKSHIPQAKFEYANKVIPKSDLWKWTLSAQNYVAVILMLMSGFVLFQVIDPENPFGSSDAVRILLLQFSCLLVEQASPHIHDAANKRQGTKLSV